MSDLFATEAPGRMGMTNFGGKGAILGLEIGGRGGGGGAYFGTEAAAGCGGAGAIAGFVNCSIVPPFLISSRNGTKIC